MNGDELKPQQLQTDWTELNPHERVPSRWHARGQGFESRLPDHFEFPDHRPPTTQS
jgi:hypothetical protein